MLTCRQKRALWVKTGCAGGQGRKKPVRSQEGVPISAWGWREAYGPAKGRRAGVFLFLFDVL